MAGEKRVPVTRSLARAHSVGLTLEQKGTKETKNSKTDKPCFASAERRNVLRAYFRAHLIERIGEKLADAAPEHTW